MQPLSAQGLLVLSFTALTIFSTSKPQSAIAQTTNSAAPNRLGNQSLYPTPACQKTTVLPAQFRAFFIPDEMSEPESGPESTNPIESRLMAITTQEELQRELDSVRFNYQKWQGDPMAMRTQTRLAQIIHALANQLGLTLY